MLLYNIRNHSVSLILLHRIFCACCVSPCRSWISQGEFDSARIFALCAWRWFSHAAHHPVCKFVWLTVPCMLVNNQSMKLHKLILQLSSEYYKIWYNVFNCRFLVRIFHSSIRNIYWIEKHLYAISWFLMKDCFVFNRMAFVGQVIELL